MSDIYIENVEVKNLIKKVGFDRTNKKRLNDYYITYDIIALHFYYTFQITPAPALATITVQL